MVSTGMSWLQSGARRVGPLAQSGARHVAPLAQRLLHQAEEISPLVLQGVAISLVGIRSVLRNTQLWSTLLAVAATYTVYLAAFYAVALALGFTVFAPIAVALLFLSPGTLVQLILVIPHWAFSLTHEHHADAFDGLLLRELTRLDPGYARNLDARMPHHTAAQLPRARRFPYVIWSKLGSSWLFSRRSLMLSVVGMVPLLGPLVTGVGQALLVAQSLGVTLLQPWLDAQGWDARTRSEWLDRHRWLIAGWALPFSLLNAVPFVGGYGLAVGQAAAAHLIYRQLAPPEDSQRRAQATSEVDQQLEWMRRTAAAASESRPVKAVTQLGASAASYLGGSADASTDGLRRRAGGGDGRTGTGSQQPAQGTAQSHDDAANVGGGSLPPAAAVAGIEPAALHKALAAGAAGAAPSSSPDVHAM